jgi:hypothetical protein
MYKEDHSFRALTMKTIKESRDFRPWFSFKPPLFITSCFSILARPESFPEYKESGTLFDTVQAMIEYDLGDTRSELNIEAILKL